MAPAPAPATSSSSQSNPAISSNSSISPNPNSSSSNQTSQLDATSHPSLAAWQRLFSRHQPVSSSTNNTQQPRRQRSGNLLLTPTTSNTDTQSQIQVQKPRNSTLVKTEAEHEDAMRRLRRMILTEGIPDDKVGCQVDANDSVAKTHSEESESGKQESQRLGEGDAASRSMENVDELQGNLFLVLKLVLEMYL